MSDHYARLGLTKTATQDQIKQAFRTRALKYHPDSGGRDSDRHEFMRIKEAYDVLKDPKTRAAYDQSIAFKASTGRSPKQPDQTSDPFRQTGQPGQSHGPSPQPRYQTTNERARQAAKHLEEVRRLNRLMSQRRLLDAEVLAQAILKRDNKEPLAYVALADIARFRGNISKAADYYGYAAQFSSDPSLVDMHLQMTKMQNKSAHRMSPTTKPVASSPILIGIFAVFLMFLYVANSQEPPAFENLPIISQFTVGLVAMLAMAGITIGSVLAMANAVEGIDAGRVSSSALPPVFAIGIFTLVNFWFAALVFVVLSSFYKIANPSLSRFLASCVGVTLAFSGAAYIQSSQLALQVLLWGGAFIVWGGIVGWMATNSFRNLDSA